MNMMGDFSYVSENTMDQMDKMGKDTRHKLFSAGGPIAKHIGCSSFGICKIGDWTFVHGGVLPQHLDDDEFTFTKVNTLVKAIMMGTVTKDTLSPTDKDLIFGENGLFWTRKLSRDDPECSLANKAVDKLNGGNRGGIIVGHTVQARINSKCNGKVWRIDNGMSGAFGDNKDKINVLEILYNRDPHELITES
jgi:hypothetical protein